MGVKIDPPAGDSRRLVECAKNVDVPGTDFLQSRHSNSNARRRKAIQFGGQGDCPAEMMLWVNSWIGNLFSDMEGPDETSSSGHASDGGYWNWQDVREIEEGLQPLGGHPEGTQCGELKVIFYIHPQLLSSLSLFFQYLDKKRIHFPRFFFISNDELLEILSETKDPLKIQIYLAKCFAGIAKLNFSENFSVESIQSTEVVIFVFIHS